MCGRYSLGVAAKEIEDAFELDLGEELRQNWIPRFNVCPGQGIPVILSSRIQPDLRHVEILNWGLVPHWTRDPNAASRPVNARAETIFEKPSFRDPVRYRRCVVPAGGYYEWERSGGKSRPFHHVALDKRMLAMAGVWDSWQHADGSEILSTCIVTLPANKEAGTVHHRMPLLLGAKGIEAWLDARIDTHRAIAPLLRKVPDGLLRVYGVGSRVNHAGEEGEDLIEEIGGSATGEQLDFEF